MTEVLLKNGKTVKAAAVLNTLIASEVIIGIRKMRPNKPYQMTAFLRAVMVLRFIKIPHTS